MKTLLALLLTTTLLHAAPTPKPPTLNNELLNNSQWNYTFGQQKDGSITFHNDGTYFAKHNPNSNTAYIGQWFTSDNNTINLIEKSLNTQTLELSQYTTHYKFQMNTTNFPKISGNAFTRNSKTPNFVELSNPKYTNPQN